MRRFVFPALGLLELAAASALVALAATLPGGDEVRLGFEGTLRVTAAAEEQVAIARRELRGLRDSGFPERAEALAASARTISGISERSRVDFDALEALRDGLGRAAEGLSALAGAVDPGGLAALGDDLSGAAEVIDDHIVPSALDAADRIESASAPMGQAAGRLADAIGAMPLDLAPLREIRDGIARLDEGLAASEAMLDPGRVAAIGDAAGGAEGVVDEAARLTDRAASYSYPVVELDGLTPRIRNRPFWPRARQVGTDLRRVAAGMEAAGDQADAIARELPAIRASIAESRRGLTSTRGVLDEALERQAEVDRLLAELPGRAAELAEALPRLGIGLSESLRAASRLGALSDSLREARRSIDEAGARWPRVQSGLLGAAEVLRSARDQADLAIRNRSAYESATADLSRLSDLVADGLPALADRLDEEDRTLGAMAGGLGQLDAVLPAYERALIRSLGIGRWLAVLVAATAGLHGCSLIVVGRSGR
ncbi:hypothetical protein [Tautonia plasticadhaerens]|uniref:Chromosome partition protein Smc n=1 Tax=Tautonia plasticadhaerens TaxID=2527974 RepID=A0A518H4V4_9BACT|nr:hypothetical protein [Tautonia plasticadhaerens]QDV35874.1 hypothetical protein ElP_37820 [Tautonia plasticadhaerens]